MKAALKQQLQLICRQHRRTIWLDRVQHYLPVLAWCSTVYLVTAAVIHQLILPLNPVLVISPFFVCCLFVLSWITIRQKPAEPLAAAAADRRLNACSLFVSAWELSRSDATENDITGLLYKRAEMEIPVWSALIRQQPGRYLNVSGLFTITLGVCGLWFLLQTTRIQPVPLPDPITTAYLDSIQPVEHSPGQELGELFGKTAQKSSVSQHQPYSDTAPLLQITNSMVIQNDAPDPDQLTRKSTRQPTTPSSSVTAGLFHSGSLLTSEDKSSSHKPADQSAGNNAATNSGDRQSFAQAFKRIDRIEIDSVPDDGSVSFDPARDGQPLIVSTPAQARNKPLRYDSDTITPYTTRQNRLSPEQRYLVNRYFKQLDKNNELSQ